MSDRAPQPLNRCCDTPLAWLSGVGVTLLLFLSVSLSLILGQPRREVLLLSQTFSLGPSLPLPVVEEIVEARPTESAALEVPELATAEFSVPLGRANVTLALTAPSADFSSVTWGDVGPLENAAEEVQRMLSLADLANAPTLLYEPPYEFPRALVRRGITEGVVVLEVVITESGTVRVNRVLSSSHPALVDSVIAYARECRFSIPRDGGRAVSAQGPWSITVEEPR